MMIMTVEEEEEAALIETEVALTMEEQAEAEETGTTIMIATGQIQEGQDTVEDSQGIQVSLEVAATKIGSRVGPKLVGSTQTGETATTEIAQTCVVSLQ